MMNSKPITREEMYLAAAAGYDVTPPDPITRKEVFLAQLSGMEVDTPEPFTRRERFIQEAAENRASRVEINNQDKTITENGEYTADEGYTGLGTVIVDVPDIPPVLEEKQISRNGTYTPSAGVDGFGKVTVNVEDIPAVLQEKTFTKNGSYTPDSGYEGISKVTVAVPDPVVKPLTVEKNGVYNLPSDADGYGPVTVNVPDIPPVLQEKSTTKNGTITPDSGYDGLSKVTVNVPDVPAVVQSLNVTENGTYTAPNGVDGYSPVTVNVDPTKITILKEQTFSGFVMDSAFGAYSPGYVSPAQFVLENEETYHVNWDGTEYECVAFFFEYYGMSMVVIGNGSTLGLPSNQEPFLITYNATSDNTQLFSTETKDSHTVGIWKNAIKKIKLQDKTIAENGTYTADSDFDGLGKVTVEVVGSGGGNLPAGVYWQTDDLPLPSKFPQMMFTNNGDVYLLAQNSLTSSSEDSLFKRENNSWTTIGTAVTGGPGTDYSFVEFNGKTHFYLSTDHRCYDPVNGFVKLNPTPNSNVVERDNMFVHENKLKAYCEKDQTVYYWDELNDAWISEKTIKGEGYYKNRYFYVYNGEAYFSHTPVYPTGIIYLYKTGEAVFDSPFSISGRKRFVHGKYLYVEYSKKIYRMNVETGEGSMISENPVIDFDGASMDGGLCLVDKIRFHGVKTHPTYSTNQIMNTCNLIMHDLTE